MGEKGKKKKKSVGEQLIYEVERENVGNKGERERKKKKIKSIRKDRKRKTEKRR